MAGLQRLHHVLFADLFRTGFDHDQAVFAARHDEIDVVLGLDAGADDYLAKPFDLDELLAQQLSMRRHYRKRESVAFHTNPGQAD